MKDLRLITFDLDDTLWPIGPTIERAEKRLHEWMLGNCPRAAHQYNPAALRALRIEAEALFPELKDDVSELRRASIRLALERCEGPVEHADEAFSIFQEARNNVEFYADVIPTLEKLQSRYTLAAISNGNACIRKTGLSDYLSFGVSAREVGSMKPECDIFIHACEKAGVHPSQVLHVGNDLECDIEGAIDAGMHAAWINRHKEPLGHPRADEFLHVHDLNSLADMLAA